MCHHGWDRHKKKKRKQKKFSHQPRPRKFLSQRPVSQMAASILKKTEFTFQTPFFRNQLLLSRLQVTILRKACC